MSGMGHFTQAKTMAEYTKSKKVPAPGLAVFVTGIMLLLGGLSILLGAFVNIGAILLIIFLIPTAFIMHNFWTVKDPMMKQQDQINFMKDLALAGAAFLIWYLYQTVPVPLSLAQ
jgi:uncharacterized membrane protein YphA (DoxX/SURF4 family)